MFAPDRPARVLILPGYQAQVDAPLIEESPPAEPPRQIEMVSDVIFSSRVGGMDDGGSQIRNVPIVTAEEGDFVLAVRNGQLVMVRTTSMD